MQNEKPLLAPSGFHFHDQEHWSVIAVVQAHPLRLVQSSAYQVIRTLLGVIVLLLCLFPVTDAMSAEEPDTITLQLRSRPYFQAAGFYTAQAMGYYRDEGLNVRIAPAQAGTSSLQRILSKKAEYGVGDISVLTAYMRGEPVIALASIFQHSSFKLISLKNKGIEDPQDLRGKRITVSADNGMTHLKVLLQQEGIPLSAVILQFGSPRAKELIAGNTDVIAVLSGWELGVLDDQRIPYNAISGQQYGVDVYGHILFTHTDEARDHPGRLDAFLRASKKGWVYAMDHPDAASRFIMQSGQAGDITTAQLMRQAGEMKNLVLSDIVDVGHMNGKRWQQIAVDLATLNLAPRGRSVQAFLYDPADRQNQRWMQKLVIASITIAILIAVVLFWNLLMQRSVKKRTRDLQDEIGKRVLAQEQLYQSLRTDQLTGLPNSRRIPEYVNQLMGECAANDQHSALLFIDLSNFQRVAVTFGRDVSNRIIVEVARVLKQGLQTDDFLARVGGDQFILIPAYYSRDRQAVADYAENYARKLQLPFQSLLRIKDHEQLISMNVGIALSDLPSQQADLWIKRAELAMYDSKNAENESVHFFNPESEQHVVSRSALELDIRRGLEQSEFLVYYQLQVDEAGRPTGAEALIRWQQAERGMVRPDEFILVSEESGLIITIGAWMIKAVCQQLVTWSRHPERRHLGISVNVSARQLHHPDFVSLISDVLARTGANPHKLRFEITESVFLNRSQETMAKLKRLKAMGITFSVDDFGTGYSSLSYLLQQQIFSELKIPRPFVMAALSNTNAGNIIDAIIRLAHALNMTIVAEGVETEDQRDYLHEHGCRRFQGYLYNAPASIETLEKLLDQQKAGPERR